jgi:hypothetical protein
VIWDFYEYEGLYADVLLIECDKRVDWNKDELGELHRKNINRFRLSTYSATEAWSLDDNAALITKFDIIDNAHTLNVDISEVERDDDMRMAVHLDLRR